MKESSVQKKAIHAGKWSFITELAAKIISPVTNIVLARLLLPEAFGVVAIVTMIISFADMLTDAGFQKYLVQHDFENEEEKYNNSNVAFWTNLGISIFILLLIIVFREQIAISVGSPGLGNVIAIAAIQLVFTSFSSIQMALYRREFDFKTLFYVRMIAICIPFIITIPLAFLGLSYWSIIIGSVFIQFANAVVLTVKSEWKPSFFYKIEILKKMLSFSIWSLLEAVSIWATSWIDVFIIGTLINSYYLGLYKTSQMMVNSIMSIVVASIVPVFFSTLSRLQNDDDIFKRTYYDVQRFVSILIFPMGIGMFIYSDLVTQILLGSEWSEASSIIGIWALTGAMMIVFGHFCSEVYRAKGRPKLSLIAQLLHLIVLVPTMLISVKYGFWVLIYARSLIRIEFVLVHLLIMKYAIGFPIMNTIKNVIPTAISAIAMGIFGHFLQQLNSSLVWTCLSILLCIFFYFGILFLFKDIRIEVFKFARKLLKNN